MQSVLSSVFKMLATQRGVREEIGIFDQLDPNENLYIQCLLITSVKTIYVFTTPLDFQTILTHSRCEGFVRWWIFRSGPAVSCPFLVSLVDDGYDGSGNCESTEFANCFGLMFILAAKGFPRVFKMPRIPSHGGVPGRRWVRERRDSTGPGLLGIAVCLPVYAQPSSRQSQACYCSFHTRVTR